MRHLRPEENVTDEDPKHDGPAEEDPERFSITAPDGTHYPAPMVAFLLRALCTAPNVETEEAAVEYLGRLVPWSRPDDRTVAAQAFMAGYRA